MKFKVNCSHIPSKKKKPRENNERKPKQLVFLT